MFPRNLIILITEQSPEPENGNEILDMTLPETLTLTQLLDMAGEHLGLNYIYNQGTIGNISVSLKLHGNLQGQMRVKDLYTLLETVLKFNNLAMIRRGNNLVAIVASDKVLEADPSIDRCPWRETYSWRYDCNAGFRH